MFQLSDIFQSIEPTFNILILREMFLIQRGHGRGEDSISSFLTLRNRESRFNQSAMAFQGHTVHHTLPKRATRKTIPGLRDLDKRAVELGGGDTHRLRLDDCVLIKDNHLKLVPSITDAINLVKEKVSFTKKIEVEVKNCKEAEEAAISIADIIMFDNLSPIEIKKCLNNLEKLGLRNSVIFEASGGITLENVTEFAASGVDIISLGILTHSVRSLNVKLDVRLD